MYSWYGPNIKTIFPSPVGREIITFSSVSKGNKTASQKVYNTPTTKVSSTMILFFCISRKSVDVNRDKEEGAQGCSGTNS